MKRSIIANFLGQVWPSFLGILLVPVYLRYLGVEAYGLIGFFVSLQALISFLDLGLSATTIREIALNLALPSQIEKARNLLRTLELINGLMVLFILSVFFLAGDWLARDWINSTDLSHAAVRSAAVTFGLMIALRWPVSIYSGVLQGANKQVLQNALYVLIVSLKGIGSAVVVAFVAPTILAYLTWQVAMAFVELILMSLAAWRSLKSDVPRAPVIDFRLIKEIWKFSASLSVTSLAAALLKQLDRVFLTKILDLRQVGYYTTASAIYSAVGLVTTPIAAAAFPRFTVLIVEQDQKGLAEVYHRTSQYASFIAAPFSAILFFFSHEILFVWTGSAEVASNAAPVLSVLAIAALFNSMMRTTFRLQLAAGITWISLWNNAVSLIVLAPVMYFLISLYGLIGAGISWALFNIFYYLTVPHIMHRHILPNEKAAWFLKDTLLLALLGMFPFAVVDTIGYTNWIILSVEITVGGAVYLALVLSLYPAIRMALTDLVLNNPFMLRIRQIQAEKS